MLRVPKLAPHQGTPMRAHFRPPDIAQLAEGSARMQGVLGSSPRLGGLGVSPSQARHGSTWLSSSRADLYFSRVVFLLRRSICRSFGSHKKKSIPSLWRDKQPAIKGLRPPGHHAGQFCEDQDDSSESKTQKKQRLMLSCTT